MRHVLCLKWLIVSGLETPNRLATDWLLGVYLKPNWLLRSGLRCLQCLFRTDTIYEIRSTSVDISTIVNYRARHRAIRERERGSPVCCQHARNMPYRSCWGFLPMRRIPWRNLQYAYVDREEKQYDTLSTHTVTSDTRTVENQASGRNFHFHIRVD